MKAINYRPDDEYTRIERRRAIRDWIIIAFCIVGILASTFLAAPAGAKQLDPLKPSSAPHTITVPGVTGPELTEEAIVQVTLCGMPLIAFEVTREGKPLLWIGQYLALRSMKAGDGDVVNHTPLERHYPGLRKLCGPEPRGAGLRI